MNNEKIQEIVLNSLPIKFLILLNSFLNDKFAVIIANSFFMKHIKNISLFCACLMIFASPFVSTGINAILVLLSTFATIMYLTQKKGKSDASEINLYIPIAVYIAIAVIAAGFSPYFIPALKGLAKMIIFLFAYFVFIVNINDKSSLKTVGLTLIVSSFIISLYGLWQFYIKVPPLALWDDSESLSKLTRVYSTLKNPNLLAGYLMVPLAVSMACALITKGWQRLLFGAVAVAELFCLYFTYSRGGWMGAAALITALALCLVFIYREQIKKIPFLKVILLGGTVGFIGILGLLFYKSEAFRERIMSFVAFRKHSSNSFRMNVWTAVIKMIQDYWVTGIGPGNSVFNKIYPLYMVSKFDALAAYNIFLEVTVELGIFGIAAFFWMLGAYLKRAINNMKLKENFFKIAGAACFAGLAGLMIHGLVDTVFYRPQIQILFWLLMAIIVKTGKISKESV